jgi:electron transfer flavoprotein alpha subunit
MLLVIVEHDRGELAEASLEGLTFGRNLAATLNTPMHAVVLVANAQAAEPLADVAAKYGASGTYCLADNLLGDYGPEAWGSALAQLIEATSPVAVLATGTDRGNEIIAQVAARLDLPMSANCLDVTPNHGDAPWAITRTRWGGSLLEDATLNAKIRLLTITHHSLEAQPADHAARTQIDTFAIAIDPALSRSVIADRVMREASGATLTTARVVVGGGRGVGSPEGFGILEELAATLGGVVGCSRAVTNSGWRNHADQVGQTGTRIAPDIYLACGISGAIQHWVGAMASKKILAINTDPEANMVTRADYAVIGDLHQVVPAINEEIKRRRANS